MFDSNASSKSVDRPTVLLGILLIYVIFWGFEPNVPMYSDPGVYSKIAYNIATYEFFDDPDPHIFQHRIGLTAPVALAYRLFGVSPLTTHLWTLCCALLTILLVWVAAPRGPTRPLAALFLAANPLFVRYGSLLFPDVVCTAFVFASCMAYQMRHRVLKDASRAGVVILSFLMVLFLFVAFLSKGTAYSVLPVFMVMAVKDLKPGNRPLWIWFYLPAVVASLGLMGIYLTFCDAVWGDPFARFRAIEGVSELHLWAKYGGKLHLQILRLTIEPIHFVAKLGMPTLVFLPAAIVWMQKAYRFYLWAFLSVLLVFWFGSASFSSYLPLPLYSRFALPLLPFMALFGGMGLVEIGRRMPDRSVVEGLVHTGWAAFRQREGGLGGFLKNWMKIGVRRLFRTIRTYPLWALFFSVSVGVLFVHMSWQFNPGDMKRGVAYGVLWAFVALVLMGLCHLFLKGRRRQMGLALFAVALSVCYQPFLKTLPLNKLRAADSALMTALKSQLDSDRDAVVLTGDDGTPELLSFFFGYRYPDGLTVAPYNARLLKKHLKAGDQIFLYLNKKMAKRKGLKSPNWKRYKKLDNMVEKDNRVSLVAEKHGVLLYEFN